MERNVNRTLPASVKLRILALVDCVGQRDLGNARTRDARHLHCTLRNNRDRREAADEAKGYRSNRCSSAGGAEPQRAENVPLGRLAQRRVGLASASIYAVGDSAIQARRDIPALK